MERSCPAVGGSAPWLPQQREQNSKETHAPLLVSNALATAPSPNATCTPPLPVANVRKLAYGKDRYHAGKCQKKAKFACGGKYHEQIDH